MNRYVLDTDSCIYWLKGDKNVEKRILEVGIENIYLTVITLCELFYGAYKSAKKEKNLKVLNNLISRIGVIHTAEETAQLYGRTKAHLEKKGEIVDDADLLIACITMSNKRGTLVTNNTEHFKRIANLKVENWIR